MIKIAFLGLFRNSKFVLYIISISLSVSVLIILIQMKFMMDSVYIEKIENDKKNRTVFISDEDIIDIEEISSKNHIIDVQKVNSKNSCLAIIDKYENVESVMKLLKEEYNCNIYDTSGLHDIKIYNIFTIIISTFLIIITFFIYSMIMLIVNNILDGEKKDIAILKAIGYSNKNIESIIFCRVVSICILSYLIRSNTRGNNAKHGKKYITRYNWS